MENKTWKLDIYRSSTGILASMMVLDSSCIG